MSAPTTDELHALLEDCHGGMWIGDRDDTPTLRDVLHAIVDAMATLRRDVGEPARDASSGDFYHLRRIVKQQAGAITGLRERLARMGGRVDAGEKAMRRATRETELYREGPSLPEILSLLVDTIDQQQQAIDTLATTLHTRIDNLDARLYGDGSQVPSQGDIPVMRRDSLELMRAEIARVVGRDRIHCTTDEAATYHVLAP